MDLTKIKRIKPDEWQSYVGYCKERWSIRKTDSDKTTIEVFLAWRKEFK